MVVSKSKLDPILGSGNESELRSSINDNCENVETEIK